MWIKEENSTREVYRTYGVPFPWSPLGERRSVYMSCLDANEEIKLIYGHIQVLMKEAFFKAKDKKERSKLLNTILACQKDIHVKAHMGYFKMRKEWADTPLVDGKKDIESNVQNKHVLRKMSRENQREGDLRLL